MMLEQTLDRVVIRICFHNKFTAGVFHASEYQVPGLGGGGGGTHPSFGYQLQNGPRELWL